jgi:ribosomal protein S27E
VTEKLLNLAREALDFMSHNVKCGRLRVPGDPCDCGYGDWVDAFRKIEGQVQEADRSLRGVIFINCPRCGDHGSTKVTEPSQMVSCHGCGYALGSYEDLKSLCRYPVQASDPSDAWLAEIIEAEKENK